jgi:dihydrofolate synthase / folylpolyglutamate synthase
MIYQETLNYLFSQLPMYHRIGAAAYKADLTNTIALCDLLKNPHKNFRSIHVAGTNGKGSVSHMLASILQEKGLKTGLFTSPHLKDFRERIRINGKMIPKSTVTKFILDHKKDFEQIQPSFFEMSTGMAFHYFSEEKIDIAVIEVGLGGRLDSTNVISPLVSVITNISFDHMQFLGDTIEKIAAEKAGIIKPKIPVIIGETQEQTANVFLNKAEETGSEICFADSIFAVGSQQSAIGYQHSASISSHSEKYQQGNLILTILKEGQPYMAEVISPLSGNYQKKNIITVLAVCEMLNKKGIVITHDLLRKGIRNVIRNTGLKGRWQILTWNPLTICDTGHNEGGLKEVLSQIAELPHKELHFVFGVVNDKEIDIILGLLPRNASYYFCKADIPRGLDQEILKKKAKKVGLTGKSYPSVKDALKSAREQASEEDLIFIGGSTFVVAEVV